MCECQEEDFCEKCCPGLSQFMQAKYENLKPHVKENIYRNHLKYNEMSQYINGDPKQGKINPEYLINNRYLKEIIRKEQNIPLEYFDALKGDERIIDHFYQGFKEKYKFKHSAESRAIKRQRRLTFATKCKLLVNKIMGKSK
jgi:hypothetical protein